MGRMGIKAALLTAALTGTAWSARPAVEPFDAQDVQVVRAWFDDASMYAFNCAFDPVCSDVGGACSGCIQTELGCETFNHGPSRSYVHGGAIDRERSVLINGGFWDASAL